MHYCGNDTAVHSRLLNDLLLMYDHNDLTLEQWVTAFAFCSNEEVAKKAFRHFWRPHSPFSAQERLEYALTLLDAKFGRWDGPVCMFCLPFEVMVGPQGLTAVSYTHLTLPTKRIV